MLRYSILLAVLLVSLAQTLPFADNSAGNNHSVDPTNNEGSLPKNVRPHAYRIKLEPNLIVNNFTFAGESQIDITVDESTETIVLHATDLKFETKFTRLISKNGLTPVRPTIASTTDNGLYTLTFKKAIAAGDYTLHLKYSGELKEAPMGFYRVKRENDEVIRWDASTQFKPAHARQAFPCFDEPAMKAPFTIDIKRPENYMALSNVLLVKDNGDPDKSWTHLESNGAMSTDDIDFRLVYAVKDESSNASSNASSTPTSSPTEPSTSSPTEPSTSSPTEPSTSSPTEPSTSSPTEPSTSSPTEPPTSSPTEPSTSSPTEPSTSSPTESSTSSSTEPSTTAPTEPSTSSPTEPSTSSPTESSTSSPTESSTSSPTEPSTSSPTGSSSSSSTGSSSSSPIDSSTSSPTSSSPVPKPETSESKPNSAPHISLPTLYVMIFIGLLTRLVAKVF